MQMLYNSDSFAVMRIEVNVTQDGGAESGAALTRDGYEIVDKLARKEMFLEGLLAERFQQGVQALIDRSPEPGFEEFDAFIDGYRSLAQQPVLLH